MKHVINLRKIGNFYQAYEEDAYVIHYVMDYNIIGGRIGFPLSALGKVQNKLEELKISYKIFDKNKEIDSHNFKTANNYLKYYLKGKESYQKKIDMEELRESIINLPEEKINKIKEYIISVIT